ncbi:TPA: hypothetical protein ACFM77_001667 [Neisseria meningitidis]
MPSEELSDGIFAFVRDIVMLPFDFQTAFCFQAFDVGMAILNLRALAGRHCHAAVGFSDGIISNSQAVGRAFLPTVARAGFGGQECPPCI